MTRQELISTLQELISGRRQSAPLAWQVEEGPGGDLRLSIDGARFDIDIRTAGEDDGSFDDIVDAMSQDERDAFARNLDEAADEAEREGPVPADELRRSLDDAITRGVTVWNRRNGVKLGNDA